MSTPDLFSKAIIQSIKSSKDARIIQPVQVGKTDLQNELVFFFKPELLDVEEDTKITNTFQLIEQKFEEFNVNVVGAVIVPGAVLDKHGIMNQHYGFINQLSRESSKLVNPDTRDRIFQTLGKEDNANHRILGGHEFLRTFNSDINTLSDVWFAQEANKLRSGFYFIEDTFEETPIILINGFHPSQLQHYTREDHRIYLMLLHTDTDWYSLKFDLVGDTFPKRAKPCSIRGLLFADPGCYGQQEVGINTNGVHLSAGPFEAAFEVVNFFGPLLELDPGKTPPLAMRRAIESGCSEEEVIRLMKNPPLNTSDLFSETENLNTNAAVELVNKQLFRDN
ncbi:MAG: hypothetical protein U9R53_06535 [Chloroflexota bacterium]|nr:hypothetical protein [Chloroflexota bacterium]